MGMAGGSSSACLNQVVLNQVMKSPGQPGLFLSGALGKERTFAENTVRNFVVKLESVLSD